MIFRYFRREIRIVFRKMRHGVLQAYAQREISRAEGARSIKI